MLEVYIFVWMPRSKIYDIIFILFIASSCHFLFSKYGFNPTDEGFVLSTTNRVLHGQIPHIDFSSVRPLGYAYLHIPELLISKTHFFLVSRFVFWLEQILIAYLWVCFLVKLTTKTISIWEKYALILICFIFNVHYFPASVLHTIDGLLMSIIGLNIIISKNRWNILGYFFIGFAALCKQNYLIVLPVSIILLGREKIIQNILTGILPIIIYVVSISALGGWNDLTTQLSGHNELLKVGFVAYLFNPFFLITFLGVLLFNKLFKNYYLSFLFFIVYLLLLITNHYHGKLGFIIVAYLVAILLTYLFKPPYNFKEEVKSLFITIVLAWCVSISVGYNSPALFVGGCFAWLLLLPNYSFFYSFKNTKSKLISCSIFLAIAGFIYARYTNIYRDGKVCQLNYKLDKLVEGASGIYTNKNTFAVLKELDSLKKTNSNLIVLPDFTACNILHSHQSKILTEWPNKTEIPNEKIVKKVTSKINGDTTLTFAVPVFQTALLPTGFSPLENSGKDYAIIRYIKAHYTTKVAVSYFIIYKN